MRQTDQTLLEQMRITELDIERRKELLNFTVKDVEILLKYKPIIEHEIGAIVADFYSKQTAIDEIQLLIGDSDTLGRLMDAQKRYIRDLFQGIYDMEYVNNRLRIGLVHKRIGVEPKLYLAAIHTLKDLLFRVLRPHEEDVDGYASIQSALGKLLYFDVTLVFETYIRSLLAEIEVAKDKAERYAKIMEEKVADRTRELERLSRIDALTGLSNRRVLQEALCREIRYAQRNRLPLCLVYFDVDNFKTINDRLGHHRGDEILQSIGHILLSVSRDVDMCFRYGGDEFCVILQGTLLEQARGSYAGRLLDVLAKEIPGVELSIGIAQTGLDIYDSPDDLIKRADARMYEAKQHPGSWIEI
ncbi:GGDEF domain-containing protein [Methylomagnum ishizawai]|uniref:GGDEF domain-containing protein n=1 Tax=Methylomagnum ishizawai TaxID=1760988 RepID=UPI001C32B78C|nr:GGDEF domain-containing protein [Methylomagnum ishizawai]BBL74662.1 sensor histidine kinase [Methylomagnum ishizawai]